MRSSTIASPLLLALVAGPAAAQPAGDDELPPPAATAPADTTPAPAPAPAPTPAPAPAPAPAATATASTDAVAVASPAEATKPWQIGVAPRLGFVVPTSKLGAMVVGGVEVGYALPALEHRLVISLDLSLTRPSYDGSVMDARIPGGSTTYTIHETEWVVGATVGYRVFGADHALVPWAAAGPVLHMLRSSESTMLSPDDNSSTSTELGVELAGGVDYRVGPGYVLGAARWVHSNLDHLLTGDTNAGKLGLEAGYRFVF